MAAGRRNAARGLRCASASARRRSGARAPADSRRRTLRLGGEALARRTLGVVATRIGPAFGVPVGALAASTGAGRAGRASARRRGRAASLARSAPRPLVFGRQLSAVLPVDLARDQLLDLGDRLLIDARDDGQRLARLAGAAGAADAMDVILGMMGRVVIDDVADVGNVEAARGDVGADEQLDLAVAERVERGHARALVEIAVQRARPRSRASAASDRRPARRACGCRR